MSTADTLAPRGIIGVMSPAMNTVIQPELELLRPPGFTNQMQRFQLGGEQISDDLFVEAEKLMQCNPKVLAIGLTTDAGPGAVYKLIARCEMLSAQLGIPVCNASQANHDALRVFNAKRVAVVTPFNDEVNQHVKTNVEAAGFKVLAIKGTESPSLEAICATPVAQITDVFNQLDVNDCDAVLQIGTALPVISLIEQLENQLSKPIVASNAAVYWRALRLVGCTDSLRGFGQLLQQH